MRNILPKYTKQVNESDVISFEESKIFGFQNLSKFIIVDSDGPIKWLCSLDDERIKFPIIKLLELFPKYDQAAGEEDWGIVTISLSSLTVNLKAPIVFVGNRAGQILKDGERSIRVEITELLREMY